LLLLHYPAQRPTTLVKNSALPYKAVFQIWAFQESEHQFEVDL